MRVLFYLPVVNAWWFDHIVAPLMRVLAREHDVHAMVPPPWRTTGLAAADVAGVAWHWLDAPEHPRLRLEPDLYPGLGDRIATIAPDLTLCRAADRTALCRFPGTVRYLMEASVPLVAPDLTRIHLSDAIFDHGFGEVAPHPESPALAAAWDAVAADYPPRDGPALADGRLLLALPLEYEGPEMFFRAHAVHASNLAMLEHLIARLPDDVLLAVTDHPLNAHVGDGGALQAFVDAHPDRIVLIPETGAPGRSTAMLARRADGMIVGDSKSIFLPAMFGTPCLRLTTFRTAAWMRTYDDLDRFLADIRAGKAITADPAVTRRFVAWHLSRASFDAADPALDATTILSRAA
jgi:hypothetical protein